MYHHIHGELVELSPTRIVIEAAGVGYEIFIPFSTYRSLNEMSTPGGAEGPVVRVLTHLLVREDVFRLYGFATGEERRLFRTVLGVNGLGPAVALTLLSSFDDIGEFRVIVEAGDPALLQRIKGIGKKLASRIILELRDHIQTLPGGEATPAAAFSRDPSHVPGSKHGRVASEAILALIELGYNQKEAEQRVSTAFGTFEGTVGNGGNPTVEAVLHKALRLN